MKRITLLIVWATLFQVSSASAARRWTSSKGGFTLEADAIAFNETTAILKRLNGKLVAVKLDELSEADQEYVRSKEVGEQLSQSIEKMQTWTSKNGVKIRGRVLAYGRKNLTILRQRAKPVINDKPFEKYDPLNQKLILRIVSELEGQSFTTASELGTWVKTLGGEKKEYPLEGVLMELESGDQIAVPFFLFGDKELRVLEPGWEAWSKANDDEEARKQESLMMQTEAMQYQQQSQQQAYQKQQIELLKLNLLATRTGLTSIWEVGLQPPPGVYGRRISVMVTARNSDLAANMALAQHPGYQVFGVRKASGR